MSADNDMKRLIVDEYLDLHRDLIKRNYGSKNIVLLQNGMFYEVYNYRLADGPDIFLLADLLNLQIGRKNKQIEEVSRKNHEMIGFPLHAQQKFINILLQNGYTIAIYNQSENGVKNVSRYLDQIISPSTAIDYCNQLDNNYLMSIYFEPHRNLKDDFYICAYSIIDLSIGNNYLNESSSRADDFQYGMDKLYQVIKIYNPKEIVCHINKSYLSKDNDNNKEWIYNKEKLVNDLEINIDGRTFHYYEDCLAPEIYKLSYQNAFLANIFKDTGMLAPIQYLELEKYPCAIISYLILLEFAKGHRFDIVEKISKPILLENTDTLLLTQNSIYQLGIVQDKNAPEYNSRNNSLLGILNTASTAFGKRQFKQRLLNPITNVDILQESYKKVDILIADGKYKIIEDYLTKVLDIERLQRRLALKVLTPNELYNLYNSSKHICCLLNYLDNNLESLYPKDKDDTLKAYKSFIEAIENKVRLDKIYKYNINSIERSLFKEGLYPEIDKLDNEIEAYNRAFELLANELTKYIDVNANSKQKKLDEDTVSLLNNSNNMISVCCNNRDERYLELTKKRADSIKSKLANVTIEFTVEVGDLTKKFTILGSELEYKSISSASSNIRIVGKSIHIWSKKLDEKIRKMIAYAGKAYVDLLEKIDKEFHNVLKGVVEIVGSIDILKAHARNAVELNLVRPTIGNREVDASYLIAEGLRHPIVERINTKTAYISNDIYLGTNITEHEPKQNHIICYGYNAVGKTTMQKAICIAVIMAQTGGYVSAKSFEYAPYSYIFTRISNVDNLLKGQSSFMVEMIELKYILKHANKRSLVCIDELVASTERYSGISLVYSTIFKLYERGCCMFMATHLHEISKIPEIVNLTNLRIYHLEVHYNEQLKELVYDRKLKPGSGTGLYGLEVAQFIGLDDTFMKTAFDIRNRLLGNQVEAFSAVASNYNQDVYLVKCSICDYQPTHTKTDIPLETHHIHFQSCADNLGNFKELGFHKNVEHNLAVLCRECHQKVHNNIIKIDGYVQTGNGVRLEYCYVDDSKIETTTLPPTQQIPAKQKRARANKEKALTDEQRKIVIEQIQNPNIKTKKEILNTLCLVYDIKLDYKSLAEITKTINQNLIP